MTVRGGERGWQRVGNVDRRTSSSPPCITMMGHGRRSVSGLGFRVAFGGELDDLGRWGDLRLGRLKDRVPPGRPPCEKGLAQVLPVRVFAGHLELLAFFHLLAERLAVRGQVADPAGHLGDLPVRSKGRLGAVGVADRGRLVGAQRLDLLVRVAAAKFSVGGDGQVPGVGGGVLPLQPVAHDLAERFFLRPVAFAHRPVASGQELVSPR